MILLIYAAVGILAVVLILLSKSHKSMNALSALHALSYLTLAVWALSYSDLPAYYLSGRDFFVDHLGLYEVIISAILFLLASVYAKGYLEGSIKIGELSAQNLKLFYAAFNFLLIVVTYSFFSNNLALFWIFAELSTVFSAVLVVTLNAKKNIGAALKYIFMASTSMIFSFIGLILIFTLTEHSLGAGTLNWDVLMLNAKELSPSILFASFAFIFIGFAAKSGVVPFHGWLPTAHSKAPAPVSVILSGSITCIGIYGILRMYAILQQTAAAPKVSMLLIAFGLLSMAVAALCMLQQVNLKKLIGFSTIENMGFLLVGMGIGTPLAIFWTLFHILVHSLTKALLFFSAGIIHHQYDSVRAEKIKDMIKLQPLASWGLIIGSAAIIGMPPFAIFISKLFLLIQAENLSIWLLFAVLVILLIAAGAFATFLIGIISKNNEECIKESHEKYIASSGMNLSVILLVALIFLFGIYFPQALSDLLNAIVNELTP